MEEEPWRPGQTIDLGAFEERFLIESGSARLGAAVRVPPAVLDWLRWRYRRLKIDRKRDEEWLRVLREDYPRVTPDMSLGVVLEAFAGHSGERLPLVDTDGKLLGFLSKTDLILLLGESVAKV